MHTMIWGKVFKSTLNKFFKGCLPKNLFSPLLNTLSHLVTKTNLRTRQMKFVQIISLKLGPWLLRYFKQDV